MFKWLIETAKKAGQTQFIQNLLSRKFQALIITVALFVYDPKHFEGYYVMIVLLVYMGANIGEKFVQHLDKKFSMKPDTPEQQPPVQ